MDLVKSELAEEEEDAENLEFDGLEEEYEEEELIEGDELEGVEYDGHELPRINEDEEEGVEGGPKKIFRQGHDELAEGEELVYDSSAYIMYHSFKWYEQAQRAATPTRIFFNLQPYYHCRAEEQSLLSLSRGGFIYCH